MANKTHSKGWALAVKNYPKYWTKEMLQNLVDKGKLFDWEYRELTGEDVPQ